MRCRYCGDPAKMREISNGRGGQLQQPLCDECADGIAKNSKLKVKIVDDGTHGDTLPTDRGMQL